MALYLQKGVWEGERILSEEFVELATTTRICTVNPDDKRPPQENINPGYGFMIWMCLPEDSYRADGMGGQYTVVLPRQDMIISITESSDTPFRVLDAFWAFLEEIQDEPLPEDEDARGRLRRRMERLCPSTASSSSFEQDTKRDAMREKRSSPLKLPKRGRKLPRLISATSFFILILHSERSNIGYAELKALH